MTKEYTFTDDVYMIVFKVIEKQAYSGEGYRYSLKLYDNSLENEIYYCDTIHNSKIKVPRHRLKDKAIKHLKDMEVI